MSSLTAKLIQTSIAAALTTGALTAVTLPTASARVCIPEHEIIHSGNSIYGTGSAYCSPPGVNNPRPVTIQRRVNTTTWTTVTPTESGVVRYQCTGTSTRTYRLKEATGVKVTAPCS